MCFARPHSLVESMWFIFRLAVYFMMYCNLILVVCYFNLEGPCLMRLFCFVCCISVREASLEVFSKLQASHDLK